MSYLNRDACAPSASSPPGRAACRQGEGDENAWGLLKLPLVSKAFYLGLSCVSAHIPPLLGGERRFFLILPFPLGRLAGHPHWGRLPGRDPPAQGEMLSPGDADAASLSSAPPVSHVRCLPPELAGFSGSCFSAPAPPRALKGCGVWLKAASSWGQRGKSHSEG